MTEAGRSMLTYCHEIFTIADSLHDHLKRGTDQLRARISIAVSSEIDRPYLAEVVTSSICVGNKPVPRVSMLSASPAAVCELLQRREVACIITNSPPTDPEIEVLKAVAMPVVVNRIFPNYAIES